MKRRSTGVDVAQLVLVSNFTQTPTAVPGGPSAGNVGVSEFTLATCFAVTSTLPTAAAQEGGRNAEGVAVAASVLPSRFAPTPTPSSRFFPTMQLGGVGVPDVSSCSGCAGTSTTAAALQKVTAVTSGADKGSPTNFTAALATGRRGGT